MNLRQTPNSQSPDLQLKDKILAELGIDCISEEKGSELCKKWRKEDIAKYKDQIKWVDEEQKRIVNEFKETKSSTIPSSDNKELNTPLKQPEIPNLNIVIGSEWFEKFKKEHLEPLAEKYKNGKEVFDPNMRRLCYIHAQAIVLHYGKDNCGNLINYLKALKFMNEWLDGCYTSIFGYLSAVREINKVSEAQKIAMEGNKPIIEEDGEEYTPLLQVKCNAELDFAALIHFYVKKLFVNDEHPYFTASSLNTIAKRYRNEDFISSYLEQKIVAYRFAVYKRQLHEYKNAQHQKKIQDAILATEANLNRLILGESSFGSKDTEPTSDQDENESNSGDDFDLEEEKSAQVVTVKLPANSSPQTPVTDVKTSEPSLADVKNSPLQTVLEETGSTSANVTLSEVKSSQPPIVIQPEVKQNLPAVSLNSELQTSSINKEAKQETKQDVSPVVEAENTEKENKSSAIKQPPSQVASLKSLTPKEQKNDGIGLEFYYENYKIYKDTRKYLGLGAAKIQRALFCAAAAILANSKHVNECYQFIYQQIESKDSNHQALAQALCKMIMNAQTPIDVKPFHYIKEKANNIKDKASADLELKEAWNRAITKPSFKKLLTLEDKANIESLVSNKPARSLPLAKHFIDGTKKEIILIEAAAAILSNSANSDQHKLIINEHMQSGNLSHRKLAKELDYLIKNRKQYENMKPFEIISQQNTKYIRSAWLRVLADKKIRAAIENEKFARSDTNKPKPDHIESDKPNQGK